MKDAQMRPIFFQCCNCSIPTSSILQQSSLAAGISTCCILLYLRAYVIIWYAAILTGWKTKKKPMKRERKTINYKI